MANQTNALSVEERDLRVETPDGDNPYMWPEFDGLQDEEAADD